MLTMKSGPQGVRLGHSVSAEPDLQTASAVEAEEERVVRRQSLPLFRTDILFASLGVNLTALALPLVILQVYDRIIPNAALSTLSLLIAGLAVVLVLDIFLKTARSYLAGWAGARFEHEAGVTGLYRLLRARLTSVEKDAAGVHLDRLAAIGPVRDFYASQASLALVDLPFVVLFLGLLAYIGGSLVFVPLVLLAVFGLVAAVIGLRLRAALANRSLWDDRRYNFIIEVLSGVHTLKALAMERLFARRHERLVANAGEAGYRTIYLSSLAQGMGSSFSQITMALVAAIGSLFIIAGNLSVGGLVACTMLAGRTVQPLLRALGLWTRFQSIRIAEERLGELAALEPETGEDIESPASPPEIRLESVSFAFAEDQPRVLDDISLAVEPGEMIGIRGGNGTGKTTLLWLLMGGLRPSTGRIWIDGRPIDDCSSDSLRRSIAYLPQRPALFEGTVLENMMMFGGDEKLEAALDLAARLGLDEAMARMPDGYDTRIGAAAACNLPAGVAQRIAIVRALLGNRKLILFDEANSVLDNNSDMRLKRLLADYKGKATILMISYRPSLLAMADRSFTLAGGGLTPLALDAPGDVRQSQVPA